MKKFILLSIILVFMSVFSFAKDINAWKKEKSLEQQFSVFKDNLNFWSGNYFLNETQLNEFYGAFKDSVSVLENKISGKTKAINALQNELNSTGKLLEDTKSELNYSIKTKNGIAVFGQNIDKSIYTFFMSAIILSLLVFLGIIFLLYKRSNTVTVRTKKDYDELKEEFEVHKRNALDRYTQINMELHHTRQKLKNS